MSDAEPERHPTLALRALGYWHLLMLLGVIAIAAALRDATGHAFAGLAAERALALAGGVALFLLGDVLFRRSLDIGPSRWRAAVAVLALATIPLGIAVATVAQLAALVGLLAAGFAAEYAAAKRRH